MYEVIEAVEYVPKKIEIGTSKWVLVKGNNDITYQVKFNMEYTYNNTCEFIGNFIGKSIGVPVPNAIFLQIPEHILRVCERELDIIIDRKKLIENIFFGIEWIYGQVQFNNMEMFFEEVEKTINYKEYPSIFPYDQYLRNYDRHIDNHLIIKNKDKQKFYYSIDSDRIFDGYSLENVLSAKNDFGCFENPAYKPLYDSITEEIFTIIMTYSSKIETLGEDKISLLDEYLLDFYGINSTIRDNINIFLKFRKLDFSYKCVQNQKCYKNVKQEILIGG